MLSLLGKETTKFGARVIFTRHEVIERQVWGTDLSPLDLGHRRGDEWAAEHLENLGPEEWYDCFDLALDDCVHEAVFNGTMYGSFSSYSDEWDEHFETADVKTQVLPSEWFDYVCECQPCPE